MGTFPSGSEGQGQGRESIIRRAFYSGTAHTAATCAPKGGAGGAGAGARASRRTLRVDDLGGELTAADLPIEMSTQPPAHRGW